MVTCNSLVAACTTGNVEESEVIFERMRSPGVVPDVVTFNSLVAACTKTGNVEDSAVILERMRSCLPSSEALLVPSCLSARLAGC